MLVQVIPQADSVHPNPVLVKPLPRVAVGMPPQAGVTAVTPMTGNLLHIIFTVSFRHPVTFPERQQARGLRFLTVKADPGGL